MDIDSIGFLLQRIYKFYLSDNHYGMFIVHDHREIPDILRDSNDNRKELAFMRR